MLPQVTREYRIERHRVPRAIAARKQLTKFGDAEGDKRDGPDPATTLISDDVFLTLTSNKEVCVSVCCTVGTCSLNYVCVIKSWPWCVKNTFSTNGRDVWRTHFQLMAVMCGEHIFK